MATIPDSKIPSVSTAALPGVRQDIRTSPADFGGVQADDMQGLAKGLDSVGAAVQKYQDNKTSGRIFDATSQLIDSGNSFQANLTDNRKGLNADGVANDVNDFYDKQKAQLLGNAQTKQEQILIGQAVERERVRRMEWARQYQDSQVEKGQDAAFDSNLQSLRQAAVGATDPAIIKSYNDEINQKIDFMAAHQGWAQDQSDQMKQQNYDVIAKSKMDVMRATRDYGGVLNYLDKNKDSISPSIYNTYHAEASVGNDENSLRASSYDSARYDTPLGDAIDNAKKQYPNMDTQRLESAVSQGYAQNEREKNDRQKNAADAFFQKAASVGGDLTKMTDADFSQLAPREQYIMQRAQNEQVKAALNNSQYAKHTDLDMYDYLWKGIHDGEFKNPDQLDMFNPSLSEADSKALRMQIIHTTDPKNMNGIDIHQADTIIGQRMMDVGMNPKSKSESDQTQIGFIKDYLHQQIYNAQVDKGRKLNFQETEDIVNNAFAKQVNRQTWFGFGSGENVPAMKMKPKDLNDTDLQGIRDALVRQGISNPTDAQIMGVYWRAKK